MAPSGGGHDKCERNLDASGDGATPPEPSYTVIFTARIAFVRFQPPTKPTMHNDWALILRFLTVVYSLIALKKSKKNKCLDDTFLALLDCHNQNVASSAVVLKVKRAIPAVQAQILFFFFLMAAEA